MENKTFTATVELDKYEIAAIKDVIRMGPIAAGDAVHKVLMAILDGKK